MMWKEMHTLPPDVRQSETALMIARGVRRLLGARGFSSLTELALTDGAAPTSWRSIATARC